MSSNLHQIYYKEYFKGVDWSKKDSFSGKIKEQNVSLTAKGLFSPIQTEVPFEKSFNVEVLYPGLVTGVGIDHEASIEGEFKLGLHFDWTYGMPVIYGSSVKGVLRSYFEDFYKPKDGQPSKEDAFDDIFNGKNDDEFKSIYDRDIFFDAVITKADKKGRLLCSDSITPHKGPLKNPIPITFMKIAPGCVIEFRFKLVDSTITLKGRTLVLTADKKLEIFKEILTTVGVGAKTNVGYGQLKAIKQ